MGRKSNRTIRRVEIADAFARALSKHGLGGASMVAVAAEAGVATSLIHHHFTNREDLAAELVRSLLARLRAHIGTHEDPRSQLIATVNAALAIQGEAGRTAARAWVGLFAEAIQSARVAAILRSALRKEFDVLTTTLRAAGLTAREADEGAAGLLSCILGSLVLGVLVPGIAAGFAAPFARSVATRMLSRRS